MVGCINSWFNDKYNVMSLQRNEIPIENHSTQTKHKRTSLLGSKRDQV